MIFSIIIVLFIFIKLVGSKSSSYSVYSWNKIEDFSYIEELQIDTIYQNIDELDDKEVNEYIKNIKDKSKVNIYSLTGHPDWYKDFSVIKSNLDRISLYNKQVDKTYRINGVVLDIEPWTVDEEWDRQKYINTMKKTYEYTKQLSLELVTVIPVWLDPSDVEIIIQNCDRVSIMNYNINNTIDPIKEEIYLAKKYEKEVDIIAEVQPINEKYGVEENTTYHYVGLDRLQKDWKIIKKIYKEKYEYKKLNFSYHDYDNLKEFIKK